MSDQQLQSQQGSLGSPNQDYQQNGTWSTNNSRGVYQQSQQSWSGSSQATVATFSAPPAPNMTAPSLPSMPGMLSANDFFQQGRQTFQASLDSSRHFMDRSMDLHAKALEQGQRNAQNTSMNMSMTSMFQQPVMQQQALPPPLQPVQNISYTQNIYHRHGPQQSAPQQLRIENNESNNRFQTIEQRRETDIRELNQAGAMMNDRLQDLEQQLHESKSKKREDDQLQRELQQMRDQTAQMARQQIQDNKRRQEEDRRRDEEYRRRHDQDRAEWQRPHVLPSQSPATQLDLDALKNFILETQSKQLSSEDVHRAVEQAINQRLLGVATREDIEAANQSMQQRLSLEPRGASVEQIQRAFGAELNKIVASIQSQREKQRQIEAPRAQQSGLQTEYIIEEIEDEPAHAYARPASRVNRQQTSPQKLTHSPILTPDQEVARISTRKERESHARIPKSTAPPARSQASPQVKALPAPAPAPALPAAVVGTPQPPAYNPEYVEARVKQSCAPTASLSSSQQKALPAPQSASPTASSTALSRSKQDRKPEHSESQAVVRQKTKHARTLAQASASLHTVAAPEIGLTRSKSAQLTPPASVPAMSNEMVRNSYGGRQDQSSQTRSPQQAQPAHKGTQPMQATQRQLPASSPPHELEAPPSAHGAQQSLEQFQLARVPKQQVAQMRPVTSSDQQAVEQQNQVARVSKRQPTQTPSVSHSSLQPSERSQLARISRQQNAQGPPAHQSQKARPQRQLEAPPVAPASNVQQPAGGRPPMQLEASPSSTAGAQQVPSSVSQSPGPRAVRQIEGAPPAAAPPEQELVRQSRNVTKKSSGKRYKSGEYGA